MIDRTGSKVPMLLYHALFDRESITEKYAINAQAFEEQISYLANNRFRGMILSDSDHLQPEPDTRHIAITFDDGILSDYTHAMPILLRHGFKATFFVTVNRIGTDKYVNWGQLKEMADSGMSIQSHSMNHVFLSDLNDDLLAQELGQSKKYIEQMLDRPVEYISLPGGFTSRRVIKAAMAAGYKGVVSSCPGLNRFARRETSPTFLNRFVITRNTTIVDIHKIAQGQTLYIGKQRLLYTLKTAAKKGLGSQLYYALWSKYFKYKM
jgi:peptidoglycan/xylan/chitin deacetylase (PgdA/CDA1 family)